MKLRQLFFRMLIVMIVITGCDTRNPSPTPEDYRMMSMIIERSHPDTVNKYLRYFIDRYQLPVSPENLADGEYYAASPKDDYGYTHEIRFRVGNGKIVDISYNEYKNGHSKTADEDYGNEMNEHKPGSAPSVVYPNYENQFTEKQNLLEMDAITGATYSLFRFRHVGLKAMDQGPVAVAVIEAADRKKDLALDSWEYQQDLNREYADPDLSPLLPEDRENFESLDFFPINEALIFEVEIIRTPQALPFLMKRTKDEVRYVKYGTLTFEYEGENHTLSVYQNLDLIAKRPEYSNYLFMPFTDLTNDETTYGGGRYMDMEVPEKGSTLTLNFNKCYNPLCHYNKKYSCPIPPAENDLSIRIEAGVKKWKH